MKAWQTASVQHQAYAYWALSPHLPVPVPAGAVVPSAPWAGGPAGWPGRPGMPGAAGPAGTAGAQAGAAATAATKMATAEKILEYCILILVFEVGRFRLKDCLGGSDYYKRL